MIDDRLLKPLSDMSFISSSILRILTKIDRLTELITHTYASGTYTPQDEHEANKPSSSYDTVFSDI